MRIRRNASKLLGSVWPLPSPPPPPPCSNPCSASHSAILCELNRSPWDLDQYNHLQDDEEQEEKRGILGNRNGTKAEAKEPVAAITSTTAELTIKEVEEEGKDTHKTVKKEIEEKKTVTAKKRIRKSKEKKDQVDGNGVVDDANTSGIIQYCKKNDGKGWKCKRPAKHLHALCQYHLTQLRSYNKSSAHHQDPPDQPAAEASANGRARRTKATELAIVAETMAAGLGADSNYYYYSGFGPWRAKRRGGAERAAEANDMAKVVENSDDDDDDDREGGSDKNNCNNSVHVQDSCNDDSVVHSLQPSQQQSSSSSEELISDGEEGDEEKRDRIRKRGRRPVKARSLKSLL